MATWNLALFPAQFTDGNGDTQNTLLHLWSNGLEWNSLLPTVMSKKDSAYIVMYDWGTLRSGPNSTIAGQGVSILVPSTSLTGSATLTATGKCPLPTGTVSLSQSAWTWGTQSLSALGGLYQFSLSVVVNGQTYTGDPEMIVQG